jgi:glutathione S-transferase
MLNNFKDTPKDVVILHQLKRGKTVPNLSPFALKLETYLRMANIPYQVDETYPFSAKGKIPWITLNGEHLADSQIILEFLQKKFNKTIGNHSEEQRALGTLARVVADEYLYWGIALWRYIFSDLKDLNQVFDAPPAALAVFGRKTRKRVQTSSFYQGIGRHSLEEILNLIKTTLKALSVLLGKKKFFLGDEPSDTDCSIFGALAQYLWGLPGSPYPQFIHDELPNLEEYSIRMKEHFWPDWDKCLAGARNGN